MPRLWHDTIGTHRTAVRDAVIEATIGLVGEHGVAGVTMSAIAERTGIGRATLYKYFPDVGAILTAWHDRIVALHLDALASVSAAHADPIDRLRAVLKTYARSRYGSHAHGAGVAAAIHAGEGLSRAEVELRELITAIISGAAKAGAVRTDIAPGELAAFVLHALTAASELRSHAAIDRLVEVTLGGLRG